MPSSLKPRTNATLEELQDAVILRYMRPGDFWVPNAGQANYIKLLGGAPLGDMELSNPHTWIDADNTDNFINVMVGGNGSGKTDALKLIIGTMMGAVDNPWFKDANGELYPFYRQQVGQGIIWWVSNSSAIRDTIIPALEKLFASSAVKGEDTGHKGFKNRWKAPNGRLLFLKTYEQEIKEFRASSNWLTIFDEPEEKPQIFLECIARHRLGGKIGFVLCPLAESAWVYNMTIGNSAWTCGAIYARAEINCKEHGLRGFLKHDNIQMIMAGYSEEERDARADAKFVHLAGRVYPMFDRLVHGIDPKDVPAEGSILRVIDPHDRRMPFISWFKYCPDGNVYQIAEWPEAIQHTDSQGRVTKRFFWDLGADKLRIEDHCRIMKDIEDRIGAADHALMDGRFAAHTYRNSGKKIIEEYNSHISGPKFQAAESQKTLAQGHKKVRNMIFHDLDNVQGKITSPKYYVVNTCQNTIEAFYRYIYDTKNAVGEEKVSEEGKDPMDDVRMALNSDFRYRSVDFDRQWSKIFIAPHGSAAQGARL